MTDKVIKKVQELAAEMAASLCEMTSIPAISPLFGGSGEQQKAEWLEAKIKQLGLGTPRRYEAKDDSAGGLMRPNIVTRISGKNTRKLWIIAHIDVVPAGDNALWKITEPFSPIIKDGEIYGRGVNDNGEEVIASLYAASVIKELGITPEYEICLCYVADEEAGSKYGIQHLIKCGIFNSDDLIYVPDSGSMSGDFIEVAEKGALWIEFEVTGKQVHASIPEQGANACRAANELSCRLDQEFHTKFDRIDSLFSPAISTFEPTRRAGNVENINTIPGRELFCFDCRILPGIKLSAIEETISRNIAAIEGAFNVKVKWRYLQKNSAAPSTSKDCDAVRLLQKAIEKIYGKKCRVGGIGGATCAACFRESGLPAVVWGQANPSAHQPDESVSIEHLVNEAKVFASIMIQK